jgi:hypothetical protein
VSRADPEARLPGARHSIESRAGSIVGEALPHGPEGGRGARAEQPLGGREEDALELPGQRLEGASRAGRGQPGPDGVAEASERPKVRMRGIVSTEPRESIVGGLGYTGRQGFAQRVKKDRDRAVEEEVELGGLSGPGRRRHGPSIDADRVADRRERLGWILSFGLGVKVVRPAKLRDRVRAEALAVSRQ